MYGEGVSKEGELLDLASEIGIVEKSGAWYAYKGNKIGQGKENAKLYLKENKKPMNTADLFKEVCKLLELSDEEYQERIGDFFESLTTSKEFILLNDGNWDLRANHSV